MAKPHKDECTDLNLTKQSLVSNEVRGVQTGFRTVEAPGSVGDLDVMFSSLSIRGLLHMSTLLCLLYFVCSASL